jgi:hypothetical protein
MKTLLTSHRKTAVALTGAVVTFLVHQFGPTSAYVLAALQLATVLGVYQVPNVTPPAPPAA